MSYELIWHSTGEVLHLKLGSRLNLDEMKRINQQITGFLDKADRKLILLLDASALVSGYSTDQHLRTTQLYRDHSNLDAIAVIANSKLNRLIVLLAFHSSRAFFVQFDDLEQAQQFISSRKNAPPQAVS